MRQIKFRGRDIKTGKYVYGDCLKGMGTATPFIRSWQDLKYVSVETESVALLIGVDKNGKEVYEGDKVIRIEDKDDPDFDGAKTFPMYASLEDYGAIRDEEIVLAEA